VSASFDELDTNLAIAEKRNELRDLFATAYFEDYLYNLSSRAALFNTVSITNNYTAKNKDFIEANNGITVKLPANPVINSEIIIANGDGSLITIDGNGTNIKYISVSQTMITSNMGSSWHFHLFDNGTDKYWRPR
jgi:hypothetical protein